MIHPCFTRSCGQIQDSFLIFQPTVGGVALLNVVVYDLVPNDFFANIILNCDALYDF